MALFVTRYENVGAFLRKTQPYLEHDEALNNLLLGIALRFSNSPGPQMPGTYFATVDDTDGIVLALLARPQVVIASQRDDYLEVIEMVANDLHAYGLELPGVAGPAHLSQAFADVWSTLTAGSYSAQMYQRLFKLTHVNDLNYAQGRLRVAVEDDFDLVVQWLFEFDKEALGDSDRANAEVAARRLMSERAVYLWEDGEPVCMAVVNRPTGNGAAIGGVYTPPPLRGMGYATSCVAGLSRLLLDSGKQFCVLFTDLANPTSNSIYPKIGYAPVCDFTLYRFKPGKVYI
jgi:predicted GNAT family acetyltransferase